MYETRIKMAGALNTKTPANLAAQIIMNDLAEQIFSMHRSGFSFEEISSFLHECDIEISPCALRDFYIQSQSNRLIYCEKMLANRFSSSSDEERIERSIFIEAQLRKAIEEGCGMFLHYQPQIDMHTGKVVGAEALLRWDINGYLLNPAEAIPIAEKTGLIVPIGKWVLQEACREAKRWQNMGLGGDFPIKMAINLSPKQFSQDLPGIIHSAICNVDLPTNLFGIEITESFLVSEDSVGILHALQKSGLHLSIDDFGTGYSCLSELKDMPLNTIKIDMAFVSNIEAGGNSLAIIETIIDLALKLGMSTIAEGVETRGQVKILKEMSCSVAQGFFYSKPLPADDFIKYVNRNS